MGDDVLCVSSHHDASTRYNDINTRVGFAEFGKPMLNLSLESTVRIGRIRNWRVGLGLQYLVQDELAIGGEYRFHHLSNKGATETNPGINTHLILFGVSWHR